METQSQNIRQNSTNLSTASINTFILVLSFPIILWGISGVIGSFCEYPVICCTISLCSALAGYFAKVIREIDQLTVPQPVRVTRLNERTVPVVSEDIQAQPPTRAASKSPARSILRKKKGKSRSRSSSESRAIVLSDNKNNSEEGVDDDKTCPNQETEVAPLASIRASSYKIFPVCDPEWMDAPLDLAVNNNNETPLPITQGPSQHEENQVIKSELGPLIDPYPLIQPKSNVEVILTTGQANQPGTSGEDEDHVSNFESPTTSVIFKALGKFEAFLSNLDIRRLSNIKTNSSS